MNHQEFSIILAKLGLNIPESERNELIHAVKYIEVMRRFVRKSKSHPLTVKSAYTVSFPEY